jgi:hypothetical protein
MAKTIEEKKKELAERRKKLEQQIQDKIKKDKERIKALKLSERALEVQQTRAERKDRTRALCLLAGMVVEDMKRNKDVAGIEKYISRIAKDKDKERFRILVKEVSGK